jgi:hypothetical protein
MSHLTFHWGAIVLSAVVAFVFGFLWYGPLFGRRWGEEMGFDMASGEKPAMKTMLWPMAGNFTGNFLIAYVLTWVLAGVGIHWGGFLGVLMTTILIWTGFYLPTGFSQKGWEQRTWGFFGINMGYHFLNLMIIGTMITYIPF